MDQEDKAIDGALVEQTEEEVLECEEKRKKEERRKRVENARARGLAVYGSAFAFLYLDGSLITAGLAIVFQWF